MSLLRMLQVLPWVGMVLVLASRGELHNFVVAWQAWIILSATALAAGLLLWGLLGGLQPEARPMRVGDLFVHLTPLYLLATVGSGDIGSERLASSRLLLPEPPARVAPADPDWVPERAVLYTTGTGPVASSTPDVESGGSDAVDLLDCFDPDRAGRTVRLVARYLPAGEAPPALQELGAEHLLYRYVITCCTADARAVVVELADGPAVWPAADSWVAVEGLLRGIPVDGQLPVLSVDAIQPIDAPARPYLRFD